MEQKFLILGDHKVICGRLKEEMLAANCFVEHIILDIHRLDAFLVKETNAAQPLSLLLVFRNEDLKKATEILYTNGITELFVFPWDTHHIVNNKGYIESIIKIDNTKPRLDYLEIEVSEGCNLQCKGCNEFSNLMDEHKFTDPDSVKNDFIKLKELFWGIGKIRLMGGEPLINPDFPKFVKIAREIFPDSDLRLLSNGLLIPKLRQEDLQEVKKYNCFFDISVYPPTKKIIQAIERRLDEFNIPYSFSLPNTYFFKSLLSEPLDSPDESFNNCLFTHCHAVNGGFLSACSNQMYATRLNTAYNLHFPENERINIHTTTLDGWAINQMFMKPHEFCRYCGKGLVPYKWKTSPKSKAKASDWLIEPTFINLIVLPFIQKFAKSPVKRLRSKIRIPKNRRK